MFKRLLVASLLLTIMTATTRADNLGFSKQHPLIFGVDMDYAPLHYVDGEGIPQGLDVEFTQELMKRLNIPFTYKPNTWKNISGDVLNGRVDLGMMVYSPYRKNITNYSRAVFRLYYQIIYRNDEKGRFDVRNLAGREIAFMASRPISDTLTKVGAIIHTIDDLPQAVVQLSKGKYDAVICFRHQSNYLIEAHGIDNLVTEDLTLTPREYCYVSHDARLIRAINEQLEQMHHEGTIDRIYGRDVTSEFGGLVIPRWAYYAAVALVIFFLTTIVVLQRRSRLRLRREMERAQRSELAAQLNEKRAIESEQAARLSEQAAKKSEAAARQSDRMKTVFLSNVSHALRTPLNAIIGFSDLMRTDENHLLGDEERTEMIQLIHRNGQQLLYFINELIQLSAIEGNEIHFERTTLDMHELMNEFRTAILPSVQEGVEVVVEGPAELHPILDANQMRIVVMHMLRNAAQHTQHGRITLRYRREQNIDDEGQERDGLRIDVADTGSGVPVELRSTIFSLLSNAHTFLQDDTPGLGLTICAAIIQAAHGTLRLETESGVGSIFIHWVPCKFEGE